jgi:hypothetical protein
MEPAYIKYHFLLAYATPAQLENLAEEGRINLCNKVIRSGPSENSWNALLELFNTWPESTNRSNLMNDVREQISGWDDNLCNLNTSLQWVFRNNQLADIALLARKMTIAQREEEGNLDLVKIAASPYAAYIKKIEIHKSHIYREGALAIAGSGTWRQLTALSCSGIALSDEVFGILVNQSSIPALVSLTFNRCGITAERCRILSEASATAQLTSLTLNGNTLGDEGVAFLASSPMLARMETLELRSNYIGDAGITSLAESSRLKCLKLIDVSGNNISEQVKMKIEAILRPKNIQVLF